MLSEFYENLVVFGEAVLLLLRKDHVAVGDDVELRLCALDRMRVMTPFGQVVREAHGPRVVAASDRAVEDLDACQRRRRYTVAML